MNPNSSFTLRAVGANGTCPANQAKSPDTAQWQEGDSFGRITGVTGGTEFCVAEGETCVLFSASEAFQWAASTGGTKPGCFGEDARISAPIDDLQIGDQIQVAGARLVVLSPNLDHRKVGTFDMSKRNRPGVVCRALGNICAPTGAAVSVVLTQTHGITGHSWFAGANQALARQLRKAALKGEFELTEPLLADGARHS